MNINTLKYMRGLKSGRNHNMDWYIHVCNDVMEHLFSVTTDREG